MNVLLMNPPVQTAYPGEDAQDSLGILYLAATLQEKGMDVRLLDSSQERASWRDVAKSIGSYSPDVVGITCTTATRFPAFRLAKMIKRIRRDATVIIGGPHVSMVPEETLSCVKDIDIVVAGEGEVALQNILEALAGKKRLPDMPGIFSREKGAISGSGFCPPVEDLAVLPLPARHLLSKYRDRKTGMYTTPNQTLGGENVPMSTTPIMTTRGCPFGCAFCSTSHFWGKRNRMRPVESVVEEMEHVVREYRQSLFYIHDDTFNMSVERVFDICDQLAKKKLGIRFSCNLRVDNVTRDMLAKMKEAGCYYVAFGVESGSKRVLDEVIGKGKVDKEKARNTARWCDELGITRQANFLYSLPTETAEEVGETIKFSQELGGRQIFSPTKIFPGTKVETMARHMGVLPQDFSWSRKRIMKYAYPTDNVYVPIFVDTRKLSWAQICAVFRWYSRSESSSASVRDYLRTYVNRIRGITSIIDLLQFCVTLFQMVNAYATIAYWKFKGKNAASALVRAVLWPDEKSQGCKPGQQNRGSLI